MSVPNHVNSTLPPVDLYLYVLVEEEYILCKRKTWATSNHPNHIEVFEQDGTSHLVKMEKVKWYYP